MAQRCGCAAAGVYPETYAVDSHLNTEYNGHGQVRVELYDVRRTKFIQAHTSALACIALSQDGRLLATASERGTLVRVHSTHDGSKLQVGPQPPLRVYHIETLACWCKWTKYCPFGRKTLWAPCPLRAALL